MARTSSATCGVSAESKALRATHTTKRTHTQHGSAEQTAFVRSPSGEHARLARARLQTPQTRTADRQGAGAPARQHTRWSAEHPPRRRRHARRATLHKSRSQPAQRRPRQAPRRQNHLASTGGASARSPRAPPPSSRRARAHGRLDARCVAARRRCVARGASGAAGRRGRGAAAVAPPWPLRSTRLHRGAAISAGWLHSTARATAPCARATAPCAPARRATRGSERRSIAGW